MYPNPRIEGGFLQEVIPELSFNKLGKGGTSLVAQWMRLCAPNAGGWVRSLVRELDPTCMLQLRVCMPQLRSLPAATKTWFNQISK